MNALKEKFRMVVLDYPINLIDDPFVRDLFCKIIKIKHTGYMTAYHPDVIPVDKSDFVGTHISLCIEEDLQLNPIFTYKSISYDRCLKHVFEFPGLSLMKSDGNPSCVHRIEQILNENNKVPHWVSFDSAWAQDPNVRLNKSPETKLFLREVAMACGVWHHQEFEIPHMITCGVKQVKTDLFFLNMGLEPLTDLANFTQSNLFGAAAVIFYNNTFSKFAIECSKKHITLWNEKLLIDGRKTKIAIAA